MLANRWLFCYNIGARCSSATPKKIMLWCSRATPRKSRNMERTITKRKTIKEGVKKWLKPIKMKSLFTP